MYVSFINREMKDLCAKFNDNMPISYAEDSYFRKPLRIDE
jgi:hypothetical protein